MQPDLKPEILCNTLTSRQVLFKTNFICEGNPVAMASQISSKTLHYNTEEFFFSSLF